MEREKNVAQEQDNIQQRLILRYQLWHSQKLSTFSEIIYIHRIFNISMER